MKMPTTVAMVETAKTESPLWRVGDYVYIQCIGPAHCKFMRWYSGNRNRVKTYGAEAVDVGWIWGKHLYAARIAQKVE